MLRKPHWANSRNVIGNKRGQTSVNKKHLTLNKIKIFFKTIGLSAILFIVIFLLTSKEKAHVDGLNEYGFPFRYYVYSYHEIEAYKSLYGFKPLLLFIDIVILIIPAFSLFYYLDKRKKQK